MCGEFHEQGVRREPFFRARNPMRTSHQSPDLSARFSQPDFLSLIFSAPFSQPDCPDRRKPTPLAQLPARSAAAAPAAAA